MLEAKIEVGNEEFAPMSEQKRLRKWERLTKPLQVVGYTLVREFYANAWVRDEDRNLPLPYTTCVRRKEINFSPYAIHKVGCGSKGSLCRRSSCIFHDDGRHYFLRRADLKPMARGWYEFVIRSIMPTGNRSEVTVERAVLVHSIIIGEDIKVHEIIAEQIYEFVNKTIIRTKRPFSGIIQRLCAEVKVPIPNDTMIPVESSINANLMERVRGEREARRQSPPHE
ncbi:hypothetical protein PIB30_057724 [Stylosanthes scabra]|uniref:Putative plant transposon protein domain-containing protein n=1 Tax=Stylosanthes scabra TaxID=79078 RepID=A0ABU6RKC0_9FABA|nr:hypothetical protein [Stylosanthes scabra]